MDNKATAAANLALAAGRQAGGSPRTVDDEHLARVGEIGQPTSAFRTPYREVRLPFLRVAEDGSASPYDASPGEALDAPSDVSEDLVKAIWFEQRLMAEHLRLADGSVMSVLAAGWWNRAEGPDFQRASIRYAGGEIRHGDIEVHVRSSAWTQHGHHLDERYNAVILHVVMWHDVAAPTIIRQDGVSVPTVPLFPSLAVELRELQRSLDVERYPLRSEVRTGFCHANLNRCVPEVLASLLDQAGNERQLAKADQFAAALNETPLPELLYQALAEGMGLTNLRCQFRELAARVSWKRAQALRRTGVAPRATALQDDVRLEAWLFLHAGLLPGDAWSSNDSPTNAYVQRLRAALANAGEEPNLQPPTLQPMNAAQWSIPGARPAGQPIRRLAAFAELVHTWDMQELFDRFCDLAQRCRDQQGGKRHVVMLRRQIEALCILEATPFWQRRVGFTAAGSGRPLKLIGEERGRILIVNVLLPLALALARRHHDDRLQEGLQALFAALPKAAENSVVRFARRRMFGENTAAARLITSTRRQQGMQQLFRDFCTDDLGGCLTCSFPSLAGALQRLTPLQPTRAR